MALGEQFYNDMVTGIRDRKTLTRLFAESENKSRMITSDESVFGSGSEVVVESIDDADITPENMYLASTEDTVTQMIELTYIYHNAPHKSAISRLINSIIDYISDKIPSAAKMDADQFLLYVTDFYKTRLQGFTEADSNPTKYSIDFKQLQFDVGHTLDLVYAIEQFIIDASNFDELKSVCDVLRNISLIRREERMSLFRGMASVLPEDGFAPGEEKND